jgi:hypothetical protein
LLDAKGENTAVGATNTENMESMFQDKKAEESFARDITCSVADTFIYLVNQIGSDEQATILNLAKQLEETREKHIKSIVVVHNLMNLRTKAEFDTQWVHIKSLYQNLGKYDEKARERQGRKLSWFETKVGSILVSHFALGREGSEAGRENDLVLEELTAVLEQCKGQGREVTLEQQLIDAMNLKIKEYYLTTQKTLQIKLVDNFLKLYMQGTEQSADSTVDEGFKAASDAELRCFDLGSYVFVRSLNKHQNYRVYESTKKSTAESTKESMWINVEIDLPGCTKSDVQDAVLKSNRNESSFLSITPASGQGVTIEVKPWLLPRPLPGGANQIDGGHFEESSMGSLRIDVVRSLRSSRRAHLSVENGILLLAWELEQKFELEMFFG